jgi:hypothetical protein
MTNRFAALLMTAAAGYLVLPAVAQEGFMDAGQPDPSTIAKYAKKPGYSPYAGRNYPTQVFWGDSHFAYGLVGQRRHVGRHSHTP